MKLTLPSVKKIDRIEDRLAGIENVLESLAAKLGNLDIGRDSDSNSNSQPRSTRAAQTKSPSALLVDTPTPATFEGETTINSQSDYAQKLLVQAIGNTPSIGENAEVKSALHALQELVSQQGQTTTTQYPLLNRSLANYDPANMDRPPWKDVVDVLGKAVTAPTLAFSVLFPFFDLKNIQGLVKDVYSSPSSSSATQRILAFGSLEKLFTELQVLPGMPLIVLDTGNYSKYAHQCREQVEVAVSQLDLVMPATYENITALVLAAADAVEMCKPSLCWVLISSAASLSMNLGYHRAETMENDTPQERKGKIHVFWMIYMFDKLLSLRLGRASMIQDWDISLPFVFSVDPTRLRTEGLLSYWVKISRIQGQTYEKLFSPAAFTKSPQERTRIAVDLVNAMNTAWSERAEASATTPGINRGIFKQEPPLTSSFTMNKSPNETELPSMRVQNNNTRFEANEDATGILYSSVFVDFIAKYHRPS